jgi:hypothetical protein
MMTLNPLLVRPCSWPLKENSDDDLELDLLTRISSGEASCSPTILVKLDCANCRSINQQEVVGKVESLGGTRLDQLSWNLMLMKDCAPVNECAGQTSAQSHARWLHMSADRFGIVIQSKLSRHHLPLSILILTWASFVTLT